MITRSVVAAPVTKNIARRRCASKRVIGCLVTLSRPHRLKTYRERRLRATRRRPSLWRIPPLPLLVDGVEHAKGAALPSQLNSCWSVLRRSAAALPTRCGDLTPTGVGCCGVPAESPDPAKTAGRLVIDAGSAPRSPATAKWQDRGDLVAEAVVGGVEHNNKM